MREILLPWDSQPQAVVGVNWGHPLAAAITHFMPLNGSDQEIVTGAALTYSSGGTSVTSERGLALQGSGAAACASIFLRLSPYNSATVSFWMYWDAYTNSDNLAMEFGANYVSDSGFLIDPSSGAPAAGLFQCGVGSPGFSNAASFARPSAADWHHYAFRFDRTSGTAQANSVFVDGVLQNVSASGTLSAVVGNFADTKLNIFSRNGNSLFGAGKMQNLAIRGGYLMTSAEVMLEFQQPWLLFEPRSFHLPRSADIGPAVCLESGALVSKSFVGTDRRVYLTTAGSLVAKAAAAGAGEKLVKMVNGRLLAG